MAKIRVDARAVAEALFTGTETTITDARFNRLQEVFEFEIKGHAIPNCAEVVAVVSKGRRDIKFEAIGGIGPGAR